MCRSHWSVEGGSSCSVTRWHSSRALYNGHFNDPLERSEFHSAGQCRNGSSAKICLQPGYYSNLSKHQPGMRSGEWFPAFQWHSLEIAYGRHERGFYGSWVMDFFNFFFRIVNYRRTSVLIGLLVMFLAEPKEKNIRESRLLQNSSSFPAEDQQQSALEANPLIQPNAL